jgi:hypothetical protein
VALLEVRAAVREPVLGLARRVLQALLGDGTRETGGGAAVTLSAHPVSTVAAMNSAASFDVSFMWNPPPSSRVVGNDSRKRFEMAEQERRGRSVLSSAIRLFAL